MLLKKCCHLDSFSKVVLVVSDKSSFFGRQVSHREIVEAVTMIHKTNCRLDSFSQSNTNCKLVAHEMIFVILIFRFLTETWYSNLLLQDAQLVF